MDSKPTQPPNNNLSDKLGDLYYHLALNYDLDGSDRKGGPEVRDLLSGLNIVSAEDFAEAYTKLEGQSGDALYLMSKGIDPYELVRQTFLEIVGVEKASYEDLFGPKPTR